MLRFFTFFLVFCSIHSSAQDITFPDSAVVVKNKVKTVSVYFQSKDGKRYQQKELVYDRAGRLVKEGAGENSFYYAYGYDGKGRRTVTTQRSKDGNFIQKFVTVYNDADGSRRVSLYQENDTLLASYVYTYDKLNRKIQEEHYNSNGLFNLYKTGYDTNGNVIASYDSSGFTRIANYREKAFLVKRRTYSPEGKMLHEYRYSYADYGPITGIIDSTGPKSVVKYEINYQTPQTEYRRNGRLMDAKESAEFRRDFVEVFPVREWDGEDYGLPVPDMVTEHKLTYDKKGNIIQDELIQKEGSFAQSFIYVYEYEFY